MTRFVTISSKALAKLVSKLGSDHAVIKAVNRGQEGFKESYRGTLGRDLREGRVLMPQSLYKKALKEAKIKEPQYKRSTGELETSNDLARGVKKRSETGRRRADTREYFEGAAKRESLNQQRPSVRRAEALRQWNKAKKEGKTPSWSGPGPYPGEKTNQYYKTRRENM
jgi:hypothetical protein